MVDGARFRGPILHTAPSDTRSSSSYLRTMYTNVGSPALVAVADDARDAVAREGGLRCNRESVTAKSLCREGSRLHGRVVRESCLCYNCYVKRMSKSWR